MQIVKSESIISTIYNVLFIRPAVADETYAIPTRDWLIDELFPFERKAFFALNCEYKDQFDCDDFASTFRVFAHLCHAATPGRRPQGITIGEVWYVSPAGRHAINCAMLKTPLDIYDDASLAFIEPQRFDFTKLTRNEINSIYFARF